MHLSFKYRIHPTYKQRVFLNKQFGCCRFIYNHFLELCSNDKTIKPNYVLINLIPEIKNNPDYSFLREVSAVALQQSTMNLITAFDRFFNRLSSYPRYKHKVDNQSFRLVGGESVFSIRADKLLLAKFPGLVRISISRRMPSKPSSVVISRNRAGDYFASFVCEVDKIIKPSSNSIGIDLGIKDFCITSTGNKVDNPRYFVSSERKLARLQRQLSRKRNGSNNRNKARLKVARLHQHIANQRNDFLHKLSTKLIHENQVICLEDLNASGMMRNRRLAKHVADVSWGRFCTFLAYKAERYQRQLMVMNMFTPSTQTCSECHVQRSVRLTLKERTWVCAECGAEHDRDVNAARLIHTVGMQHWFKQRDSLATLMLVPRWKNGQFLI